jgi:hypothetical protein
MCSARRLALICLTLLGCGVVNDRTDDTIFCFLDKQLPQNNPRGRYSCVELEGKFTEEFAKPFMESCGASARPGDPAGWTSMQGHGRCPKMVTDLGGCELPFELDDAEGNVGRVQRRYPGPQDCLATGIPIPPAANASAPIDYSSALTAQ